MGRNPHDLGVCGRARVVENALGVAVLVHGGVSGKSTSFIDPAENRKTSVLGNGRKKSPAGRFRSVTSDTVLSGREAVLAFAEA
jgi:hypothetical protein